MDFFQYDKIGLLAMQTELKNGVFSPPIAPIIVSGLGLMAQTNIRARPRLLSVVVAPPEPEMQFLFPAPVIAPYRAPKQGRN